MALILGNSFWGIGAVVGALGLATTHPVAFLMIRQLLAGLLLLLAGASSFAISSPTTVGDDAAAKTSKPTQHLQRKMNLDSLRLPFKQHWKSFALLGLTLFGSQFGTSYRTNCA
jgi:sulfite exporter TauE/SafE